MDDESLKITLTEKLNLIADLRLRYKEAEIKFKSETAELTEMLENLENDVNKEVLSLGSSVKTDYITAVYNKGKETWDKKLLSGYAETHPEILAARKIGEPSVSFHIRTGV